MGKEKRHYTLYQSMPNMARFWLHSEACYTEAELELRTAVLQIRAHSGIHSDYLNNPSSWFSDDDQQALINVYEHSWFFSNAFKTRQVLTRDDFFVQPVDTQRLQWSVLYELMQKTGDYLLLRNKELSAQHLNQPMNFILLDINHILKGISQNPNIGQTQEQLVQLLRYVRTIEKNTSPLIGSDRLFLANFRSIIDDEVQPQLIHLMESLLLKDRLGELSKTIKQISEERNRILHFAWSVDEVNPHPGDFLQGEIENLKAYPTLAAKACGTTGREIASSSLAPLRLSAEQLQHCNDFKLITMDEKNLEYYAKAISDLNELTQFQKILHEVTELLGQAGEVYTVFQFKEQLLLLLGQIDHFIEDSSLTIDAIIHENTLAYHKAIQDKQNLSLLKKLLTTEHEKLNTFIKNQDVLAQFPSTSADLAKTNQVVKQGVSQIVGHLNQPSIKKTNFAALTERAQQLNILMDSMHGWVKNQYSIKGLAAPKIPERLTFLPDPPVPIPNENRFFVANTVNRTSISCYPIPLPSGENKCIRERCSIDQQKQTRVSANAIFFVGLISMVPIVIFLLYIIFRQSEPEQPEFIILGNKREFDAIKTQLDDLIARVKDTYEDNDYAFLMDHYSDLIQKAQSGRYEVSALKELYEDLNNSSQELLENAAKVL